MAGILGFVGSPKAPGVFPQMLRFARLHPWYETAVSSQNLAACGLPGLGNCVTHETSTIVFYGEIFNAPADVSPAAFLLDGFLTGGKSFLATVNGRFQAAVWDSATRKMTLFCDLLGTRPLYWTRTADGFLFAPQIKTLLQCPDVSRSLDREALVDFFTWGQYLRERTSVEGVELLPPAGFYTWEAETGKLTKDRYFTFPIGSLDAENSESSVEEVAEAFRNSVLAQTQGFPLSENDEETGLGISLSGGLDARSVLGMIPKELQKKMTSVALGVPGSADHRLATALAERAGTNHFNYELNTDFLENYDDALTEMVRLTDGQYLSSSIVIPTLNFYREKGLRTLLRGHAGELFHMTKAYAFSMKEADRKSMANGTLSPKIWAFQHLQAFMLDGVKTDLLHGISRPECTEMARQSLNAALDEVGGDSERENAVWRLYLAQRVFREIPLSMRKFDSFVNVRLPFLNRELEEALFRLPSRFRMGETIQHFLLKKWRRDFLKVKNVNTGTYIGAPAIFQKFASLKHRILAKLGVKGYQPYEKMGLWLRRELKPLVSELLLKDGLSDRGIFNPDTISDVVQSHNSGKNHTYLILALLILEKQMRFLEI